VGAHGHLTQGTNLRNPGTKYKSSKKFFVFQIYYAQLRAYLGTTLQLPAQSLTINSKSRYPLESYHMMRLTMINIFAPFPVVKQGLLVSQICLLVSHFFMIVIEYQPAEK